MKESTKEQILKALQAGQSLTPISALERFNCFRLGARIYDIRKDGYKVRSEPFKLPSGKIVSRYSLEP